MGIPTCIGGISVSIIFPMFKELKEVCSKGKRRLLIVSTPSLCPPKRMNSEVEQGLMGRNLPEDTQKKHRANKGKEAGGSRGGSYLLELSLWGSQRVVPALWQLVRWVRCSNLDFDHRCLTVTSKQKVSVKYSFWNPLQIDKSLCGPGATRFWQALTETAGHHQNLVPWTRGQDWTVWPHATL